MAESLKNPCSPENGGWTGPAVQEAIAAARPTDAYIAAMANAHEVSAWSEAMAAKNMVLDRPYRHKRKARHEAQAAHEARLAYAFRELLARRQGKLDV